VQRGLSAGQAHRTAQRRGRTIVHDHTDG
jgi:hypothetical protein